MAMIVSTPVGSLVLEASDRGLTRATWWFEDAAPAAGPSSELLESAAAEVEAYFEGTRRTFDLPIDLGGVGTFDRRVLDVTVAIPYGETRSYGEIAAALGETDYEAARAVGGALRRNPVAVIVPCHRVIASDGSLTGYGGGPDRGGRLDVKRTLLELEQGALQQRLW
jgi:methylated-DNA-[protein]-cysteine S-methyltransferase